MNANIKYRVFLDGLRNKDHIIYDVEAEDVESAYKAAKLIFNSDKPHKEEFYNTTILRVDKLRGCFLRKSDSIIDTKIRGHNGKTDC